ncbi:MAG: type I restriction-modification system subunit M N-terminal domain-containing protein [Gemmatimonadetes bacterium]|nr:type I restriction-modification system subunit M N-terminal domain-containing protein [Gemmatimonadota bacterium]
MSGKQTDSGATTGYEAELWAMADTLRGSMDAAEYMHVVLGLIFLRYISDAFEERRAAVLAKWGEEAGEDRDEYIAENIFWVPPDARWARLKAAARQPTVGQTVDWAMTAIERDNPALKEVLAEDKRWRYGVPPKGNANFAWVQHMVHHLAPKWIAGFVLANGSMSSQQSDDGEPFEAKMKRLVVDLCEQQAEGVRLDAAITENLHALGLGVD